MKKRYHINSLLGKKSVPAPVEPHQSSARTGWRFNVILPVDGSHTGRYVLLCAVSPQGYPNNEDYILLVRRPGEVFRPAYMVHVPFDEDRPALMDFATQPEVTVVYQAFTLAWTDDGGKTIHRPPREPDGLFNLWRFGAHWIDTVEVKGEHLYVRMGPSRDAGLLGSAERNEFFPDQIKMWRFRLDGTSVRAELVEPPVFDTQPSAETDVFVRGGSRLLVRSSPRSDWMEIPPEKFIAKLREATVGFFGGSGARQL